MYFSTKRAGNEIEYAQPLRSQTGEFETRRIKIVRNIKWTIKQKKLTCENNTEKKSVWSMKWALKNCKKEVKVSRERK